MLIVTPSFSITGGVANHHHGLRPYWSYQVGYAIQGKRSRIPAIITLVPDYIVFLFKLMARRINVVMINPSLRPYQLKRDAVYLLLARLFGKKVVTIIHGWGDDTYQKIAFKPKWFCWAYGKSSVIFVLYSGFRDKLLALPLRCKVELTTTKVRNSLTEGFEIACRDGKIEQILFLARADKTKGLDVTIKAFEILKESYPKLRLCVCGDGNALEEMKSYVHEHALADVQFMGKVAPDDVKMYYVHSQIYLLPTTHGEGMATTVLEAMAMGLVVITRPIGGVKDFFVSGEMGYLTESVDAKDYAQLVETLLNDSLLAKKMAHRSYDYAMEHFLAQKVVEDLERKIDAAIS